MLLRIAFFGGTLIDLSKHVGRLAVELDMDLTRPSRVTYCGPEGYGDGDVLLEPDLVEEGVATWFLEPSPCAPSNQIRRHRYLVQYPGGDTYVAHPAYRNLILIEHGSDVNCWELAVEGIPARIVMPPDFKACEIVQES